MSGSPFVLGDEPLVGTCVRLEPLTLDHVDALWAAASEDRATFGLTSVPSSHDSMRKYVTAAIDLRVRGLAVPFATRRLRGDRIVGSTRFCNVERWEWLVESAHVRAANVPDAVEIGWTWLAPSAQRTEVNTEAKLLMLRRAFDDWKVHRVTLCTDARNARSRANIERVGAKLDGVLRANRPASDGLVRDTAYYSIVAAEWSGVHATLASRAAR